MQAVIIPNALSRRQEFFAIRRELIILVGEGRVV
jgi:hypothetical protein